MGINKIVDLLGTIHNNLIFYPTKEISSSPSDIGIDFEEVFVDTDDKEKLYGYFLPAKTKTEKVTIYLHGNAQNVGDWYPACVEIQKEVPVNMFLIDYRGYGSSTGVPSAEGVNIDAVSMYNFVLKQGFKPENISIYGRSIGGAIGLELASKVHVRSVVVQSSFISFRKIAKELYPFIPDTFIKDNYWDSAKTIKNIKVPVLISHGDKDEIIPISHSKELFKSANEPKKLIILKGATHNDISRYFTSEYFQALEELLLK